MNSDILGNEYDPDDPTYLEFIVLCIMLGVCMAGTVIARTIFQAGRFVRWCAR